MYHVALIGIAKFLRGRGVHSVKVRLIMQAVHLGNYRYVLPSIEQARGGKASERGPLMPPPGIPLHVMQEDKCVQFVIILTQMFENRCC